MKMPPLKRRTLAIPCDASEALADAYPGNVARASIGSKKRFL
jgi:hypothetical protein